MLQEIPLQHDPVDLPDDVADLLDVAERRCEAFYAEGLGPRYYRYVPSDPTVVFRAMDYLVKSRQLRGMRFCELGCGFGIATGMAALLGFRASGIELETELFERAKALHRDVGLDVEILNESYLPEGYESVQGIGGKDLVVPSGGQSRGGSLDAPTYEGIDPAEVDLFFVYPWPDEEEFMRQLFDEVASDGAVLLMYQGEGEISAYLREEEGDDFGDFG
ncbi:hypothetical protein HAHE_01480 [Haloferula helveola]|uniref:Methyltransferase domain-containing protein n=1 Tax=Haloferula helveola TaxID=490095 RepID=A0ABM7R9T2_9BACT|nr:hypothetical protein HAHE_01480 [Haloferula helveola]